jgi:hypothetical protein
MPRPSLGEDLLAMAFLKKHAVWIILALVLAAEGGFTFVLLGKRSKAKSGLEELVGLRKRLAELKAKGLEARRSGACSTTTPSTSSASGRGTSAPLASIGSSSPSRRCTTARPTSWPRRRPRS